MMTRYLSKVAGLRVFYPEEINDENGDFKCNFETFGMTENISGSTYGIDPIDALVNAMMRLDLFLKSSSDMKAGSIKWLGALAPDDFGLCVRDRVSYLTDQKGK